MPSLVDLFQTAGDAQTWVTIILDSAIKGVMILAMAGAVAVIFRHASAAVRHLAWGLAVVGLCVLPVLSAIVPRLRVPILPPSLINAATPSLAQAPVRPLAFRVVFNPDRIPLPRGGLLAEASTRGSSAGNERAITTNRPAMWILFGWAGGALMLTARLLVSVAAVWHKGRRAAPIADGAWAVLLEEIAMRYGIRRRVSLRVTSGATIPATWGLSRPVILLPVEAIDWPEERLRAVLLHELAHIARGDFLTQTVAQIACALHWFNPLAWLAERRLRVECEQASDDLVLGAGLTPSDYASHLVAVLMAARGGREAPLCALAMARRGGLEDRLRAILDCERSRCQLSSRRVAVMALAAACFLLPLGFVRLEARAHDAPKLERLPQGMTIEVVGISTHPSGPATWWGPDGTPLAQAPCDPAAKAFDSPGRDVRVVVARIKGLPEGANLEWHATQCRSQMTPAPRKEGKPVPELQRLVAEFAEGLATCDVHFDLAIGPWTTERVFDGSQTMGITTDARAYFFGKAREIRQGTAISIAHNITDRVVRLVAIDQHGHERTPVSAGEGGAGHFRGIDAEFDLPPSQIREYRVESRQVGRFEIKNIALQPRKAGP